ncbi:hypothetical protein AB0T83_16260 [Fluviibacterium sp. DFM31]|uniref:Uncharacterized protein n=1 Tax=Meridianimarinicoccus marinus TaxID=3231483 RepID=A0ABV3L9T7_9RHOB
MTHKPDTQDMTFLSGAAVSVLTAWHAENRPEPIPPFSCAGWH